MKIPTNLKYTKEHEWIDFDSSSKIAKVGITDFAQKELGDIVYIEIETLGETLKADEVFGSVEAVKTVSDLFLPIAAKITSINENIESQPELVNSDPYEAGWMVEIEPENISDIDALLSAEEYQALIG